jgi:hypothetical protein
MPKDRGGWEVAGGSKDELRAMLRRPMRISDSLGMEAGEAQRALTYVQRHGFPRAKIVPRDNGLFGIATVGVDRPEPR